MAAAAGQNSVCGRRCPESRVHTGHIDIIENMVSERTGKWLMHDDFSPFFCVATWFIETLAGGSSSRGKFGLWEEI